MPMGKSTVYNKWGELFLTLVIINFLPEDGRNHPIPRFKKYIIMEGCVFKTFCHKFDPISDHVDLIKIISRVCLLNRVFY